MSKKIISIAKGGVKSPFISIIYRENDKNYTRILKIWELERFINEK